MEESAKTTSSPTSADELLTSTTVASSHFQQAGNDDLLYVELDSAFCELFGPSPVSAHVNLEEDSNSVDLKEQSLDRNDAPIEQVLRLSTESVPSDASDRIKTAPVMVEPFNDGNNADMQEVFSHKPSHIPPSNSLPTVEPSASGCHSTGGMGGLLPSNSFTTVPPSLSHSLSHSSITSTNARPNEGLYNTPHQHIINNALQTTQQDNHLHVAGDTNGNQIRNSLSQQERPNVTLLLLGELLWIEEVRQSGRNVLEYLIHRISASTSGHPLTCGKANNFSDERQIKLALWLELCRIENLRRNGVNVRNALQTMLHHIRQTQFIQRQSATTWARYDTRTDQPRSYERQGRAQSHSGRTGLIIKEGSEKEEVMARGQSQPTSSLCYGIPQPGSAKVQTPMGTSPTKLSTNSTLQGSPISRRSQSGMSQANYFHFNFPFSAVATQNSLPLNHATNPVSSFVNPWNQKHGSLVENQRIEDDPLLIGTPPMSTSLHSDRDDTNLQYTIYPSLLSNGNNQFSFNEPSPYPSANGSGIAPSNHLDAVPSVTSPSINPSPLIYFNRPAGREVIKLHDNQRNTGSVVTPANTPPTTMSMTGRKFPKNQKRKLRKSRGTPPVLLDPSQSPSSAENPTVDISLLPEIGCPIDASLLSLKSCVSHQEGVFKNGQINNGGQLNSTPYSESESNHNKNPTLSKKRGVNVDFGSRKFNKQRRRADGGRGDVNKASRQYVYPNVDTIAPSAPQAVLQQLHSNPFLISGSKPKIISPTSRQDQSGVQPGVTITSIDQDHFQPPQMDTPMPTIATQTMDFGRPSPLTYDSAFMAFLNEFGG
ncbi:hypothetical protein AMATHDRAFT_42387 [Amanita thiersii Skay4041]|uniref:Uncharacterized protein n=1 Tax=Amanita thiersii Skay4041 TaxID=703135 RepID=A0A2A9NKH8_9AGAR|nr:hypothetical protein AMATHDRAFT_42387 [Amanita thiersii Skay4041]